MTYRYLNETERANRDIYNDYKLKKNLWSLDLYKTTTMDQR